jgi:hypothetical protein
MRLPATAPPTCATGCRNSPRTLRRVDPQAAVRARSWRESGRSRYREQHGGPEARPVRWRVNVRGFDKLLHNIKYLRFLLIMPLTFIIPMAYDLVPR